jgi:hypothetical protein
MVNANLFKFLPKIEFARKFIMTGELEFKDPYREYPRESNVFYNQNSGFFRLSNLFVSCFSANDRCYLDPGLWKKFGGNGEGVCLGFLDNSTNTGSYSFYEHDGTKVFGTYCQYPKGGLRIKRQNVQTRDVFEAEGQEIFYFVTKNRSKLHEHEKRYFFRSDRTESRIMHHFGVKSFLYFNAIVFGDKVPSGTIDDVLALCPAGFSINKWFQTKKEKSRLTLISS